MVWWSCGACIPLCIDCDACAVMLASRWLQSMCAHCSAGVYHPPACVSLGVGGFRPYVFGRVQAVSRPFAHGMWLFSSVFAEQ